MNVFSNDTSEAYYRPVCLYAGIRCFCNGLHPGGSLLETLNRLPGIAPKDVDKAAEPSYTKQRRWHERVSDSTGSDRGMDFAAAGDPAENGDTYVNERCLSGDKKKPE
jgi:hypothetical protein